MKRHRVPTAKEAHVREPDGIHPDVQIACKDCGKFGVKDGEEGCDFWAESVEVRCPKIYSGVRCDRTVGHIGGCIQKWRGENDEMIGMICLDRRSFFEKPGTIKPDEAS